MDLSTYRKNRPKGPKGRFFENWITGVGFLFVLLCSFKCNCLNAPIDFLDLVNKKKIFEKKYFDILLCNLRKFFEILVMHLNAVLFLFKFLN